MSNKVVKLTNSNQHHVEAKNSKSKKLFIAGLVLKCQIEVDMNSTSNGTGKQLKIRPLDPFPSIFTYRLSGFLMDEISIDLLKQYVCDI